MVRGLVQGVGFRPFVYRTARHHGITGCVRNRSDGVYIHAEGEPLRLSRFLEELRTRCPPASVVEDILVTPVAARGEGVFRITESGETSGTVTRVGPDLAVCAECLLDMRRQPRRRAYPFVNCTRCGPRFSIIRALPYDRARTSMAPFEMCEDCRAEYEDIEDRRFHAQPVACHRCGPSLELTESDGEAPKGSVAGGVDLGGVAAGGPSPTGPAEAAASAGEIAEEAAGRTDEIIGRVAARIAAGGIVALKGLGGFHLACDAANETAVRRLRAAKAREGKPFAVMFRDLEAVRRVAHVSEAEARLLESVARPIVLLRLRDDALQSGRGAVPDADPASPRAPTPAPGVTVGLYTVGAMLPYMPLHHLLFERLPFARLSLAALVMTSGNMHDEPIVTDNEVAARKLLPKADALLTYDRAIVNRVDDSVSTVVAGRARVLRRSRGYVPLPVRLPREDLARGAQGILAVGADSKACFCLGTAVGEAVLSQHIGEMEHPETAAFFADCVKRFVALFRSEPQLLVRDLHPDYVSTAYAEDYGRRHGLTVYPVQHHHAHIASCMAEKGLDETVIGISLDGTGYGEDGTIWGGEALLCDLAGYRRAAHFDCVPMPGGEAAVREPWRMAVAYLRAAYGEEPGAQEALRSTAAALELEPEGAGSLGGVPGAGDEKARRRRSTRDAGARGAALSAVLIALEKGINTPLTSSAGRLFDAVAAILGLCRFAGFEAEGPMRLETAAAAYSADPATLEPYPYRILGGEVTSAGPAGDATGPDATVKNATAPDAVATLSFLPAVRALAEERLGGGDLRLIAARFHSTIIDGIGAVAAELSSRTGLRTVVCSGGLFQNRIITAGVERRLASAGFAVHTHETVPCNDGGIALGQLAVAARRRMHDVPGGSGESHLHSG
ncbi:MAG: carbamoyltransferase HypF [Spirochaetaceae bacterium]